MIHQILLVFAFVLFVVGSLLARRDLPFAASFAYAGLSFYMLSLLHF